MKLLYDLENEGVSNKRIQDRLNSLDSFEKKNDYCKIILEKKASLLSLYEQYKILSFKFPYSLDIALQNLDVLSLIALKSRLKENQIHKLKKEKKAKRLKAKSNKDANGGEKKSKLQIATKKKKKRQSIKQQIWSKFSTQTPKKKKKSPRPWGRVIYTGMTN